MSSIFSKEEKGVLADMLDDVHDTFKRKIIVFVKETTSISFPSSHNALYNSNQSPQGLETLMRYEIDARVHYERWNPQDVLDDVGLPSSENILRLKIKPEDYEIVKKATAISVDEEKYSLIAAPMSAGPFDVHYHILYLRRDA